MGTQNKNTKKSWKEKAIERGKALNREKQEKQRQKLRAEKWRSNYYSLKKEKSPSPVKGHSYCIELIWMAVLMHIKFNISLRGVSQSIEKLGQLYGLTINYVSHMTIRNWCLKFGLYRLCQPIDKGKYVLISDESIEIGRERLLLLYLVEIGNYSPIVPLGMEDVKVLDLGVQTAWSSDQVSQKIKEKTEDYGIEIMYSISDNCSKLKKAMSNCNIKWISDCTHEIANVSKALFKKDETSNRFITKMNLLRSKWILSKHMLLVPPEIRTKSRFNQMFIIHKWADQILEDWEGISQQAKKELVFVQENKGLIKSMRQCYELIELFCSIFKSKGIQDNSLREWKLGVQAYKDKELLTEKAVEFIERMNSYLERTKSIFTEKMQIICCSDIIESTFGKYKNKGTKMITEDVLKIAGYSSQNTLEETQQAMQQIKIRDVLKWKEKNTTISKLALLKRKKKMAA